MESRDRGYGQPISGTILREQICSTNDYNEMSTAGTETRVHTLSRNSEKIRIKRRLGLEGHRHPPSTPLLYSYCMIELYNQSITGKLASSSLIEC